MHIAFVTPESPYSEQPGCGVAAYLRAIIPAIADAGHDITIIANAKDKNEFSPRARVVVRHFRLPSLHWYAAKLPLLRNVAPLPMRQLEWSRAFSREVARVAALKNIDVIESTEAGSLFLNRIAPLVIRLHGSQQIFSEKTGVRLTTSVKWSDSLEARACAGAAAITAPSEFHARQMAHRRGWQTSRVQVIANPVSTAMMESASQFQRNGDIERVVLYAGRLAPVKGIETLLRVAKLVRETDSSINFVLAGPWQMPKPPEAYGLALNGSSSNGIEWVGPKSPRDLMELYKRATVFVMPSYYETFSISVAEAMAYALPTVASNAGALPELVTDGKTGLLVPAGNAEEMASGLLRLLTDDELRMRLARKAGDELRQKYSLDGIVRKTLAVYASVSKSCA